MYVITYICTKFGDGFSSPLINEAAGNRLIDLTLVRCRISSAVCYLRPFAYIHYIPPNFSIAYTLGSSLSCTNPSICIDFNHISSQRYSHRAFSLEVVICWNLVFWNAYVIKSCACTIPSPRGQSSVVGGLKWWLSRGCKRPFHREAQIWVKQYLA